MALPAPVALKIAKLIPRLATDHDGEVVATARAVERTLKSAGCDWHDLASALGSAPPSSARPTPQPRRTGTWLEIADWCARCPQAGTLSPKEAAFVLDMVRVLRRDRQPTAKQGQWLRDIFEKLRKGTA